MSPNSSVLIDYWKRLPTLRIEERRTELEQLCNQERAGAPDRSAFLPYALADDDEYVVHRATLAYVAPRGGVHGITAAAIDDALEWIRRRLALNRGAVFAALLALDDETVTAALGGLRLSLDAHETAIVFRRGERMACARTRQFLEDWQELVDTAPSTQPAELLAAA